MVFHFASRLANSAVSFGLFPDYEGRSGNSGQVWGWARIVRDQRTTEPIRHHEPYG